MTGTERARRDEFRVFDSPQGEEAELDEDAAAWMNGSRAMVQAE